MCINASVHIKRRAERKAARIAKQSKKNIINQKQEDNNVEEEQKIYFIGGAYYNKYSFNTYKLMNGIPIGKSFFSLSYDDNFDIIEGSFKIEKEFTGSGRFSSCCFKINNYIYVLGGC